VCKPQIFGSRKSAHQIFLPASATRATRPISIARSDTAVGVVALVGERFDIQVGKFFKQIAKLEEHFLGLDKQLSSNLRLEKQILKLEKQFWGTAKQVLVMQMPFLGRECLEVS